MIPATWHISRYIILCVLFADGGGIAWLVGVEEIYSGKRFRGDQVQRHSLGFAASFVRGVDSRGHRDCAAGGLSKVE